MTRNVINAHLAIPLFFAAATSCYAPPASPPARPTPARDAPRNEPTKLEVLPIAAGRPALTPAGEPAAEPFDSVPFTIPLPQNVACKLEDATKTPPSVELGLSREGPAFGEMRARTLVARIGVGGREIVVDAEGTGIRVRAIAVDGSLDLFPASPITFEDLLVTQSSAELVVVAGASGGIEASLALPKQIVAANKKTLTARVPCGNLRLHESPFDALESVGSPIGVAYLARGGTAITTTAGGKAVAMLNPRESSLEVQVLAREGRHTRIAWALAEAVAVGWVDNSRLRTRDTGGDEFGVGGLGLSGIGTGGRRVLRCDADVPVRAQVGTRTEIIGVVLPGTLIAIEGERPYAFEVDLPSTALDKHEKAVLLVDKDQIGSCRG